MSYQTTNEIEHFDFQEAHIADVEYTKDLFHVMLDQVLILPENSCNRDIRTMRANGLELGFKNSSLVKVICEGRKVYDPDGKLMREEPDEEISEEKIPGVIDCLADGYLVELERKNDGQQFVYTLVADGTDERTYDICIRGTGDFEKWDRFLNV